MYIIYYITETDGDTHIKQASNPQEVSDFITSKQLQDDSYSIVEGKIIKCFDENKNKWNIYCNTRVYEQFRPKKEL